MHQSRRLRPLAVMSACVSLFSLTACTKKPSPPDAAVRAVTGAAILKHIQVLASDEFEGRAPGSKGEERTLRYLEEQFRTFGLEPGHPDGTYLQKVPLVGITADPSMKLTLSGRGRRLQPKFGPEFVAWSKRVTDSVSIENAEMIFAGYGVQAPEFQWDDFKGLDVKGKVIVVLVNDPPVEDQKIFGGPAMTYYGRWTYKYEKAAELGAAGCFIIHETGPAGYPWAVVENGRQGEQFDLSTPDKNMGRAAIEGWFTWEMAEKIFKSAGKNLAELKKAAVTREFQPVPLGVNASLTIQQTLREVTSYNVVARLAGSDEKLRNEYVAFVAHWDHLGIGPEVSGDKIYNGALDNASGTAALLEIARGFKQLETPPRRSLLFIAVTAEEQGLLGSQYYGEHPLYPLARTAAVINMDGMNLLGRTKDLTFVGMGSSSLDEVVSDLAAEQGRTVKPDPEPEKGFFYRSDHFNFAKQGVPAFYPHRGIEYIGKPEGWGIEMRQKYTAEDYHKPSDQVKDYWEMSGAEEDARLFLLIGYRVANADQMPTWKPGTEFKAKRDASLKGQ
jgi:Zn-dependent M28 family amino/carboxypeptidase